MDELLKRLLKNSKVTSEMIKTRICHPITYQEYPKRTYFAILKKYASDFLNNGSEPRMIGIAGLRGTGKTTLMWQVAGDLMRNYNYPLYFFNVNEITTLGYDLIATLDAFQEVILKKRFNQFESPIILMFDEVHDAPDWAKALKILYDEARSSFTICTGSSALLLRHTADLARRIKIERLYPFRFTEFITAKSFFDSNNKKTVFPIHGLAEKLKQAIFFTGDVQEVYSQVSENQGKIENYFQQAKKVIGKEINSLIEEYIKYYNIPAFLLYKEREIILENTFELFKRVVYEDTYKINVSIETDAIYILKLLMQLSISDEINPDLLSQKTGIRKDQLNAILDIMEKAELINILNPYVGTESRIWKNKKAFFMSPSLRLSLLSIIYGKNVPKLLSSKLYEDMVVMYLKKMLNENQILFAKTDSSPSPDFVIETMDNPILIEVGIGKIKTFQLKSIKKRYGLLMSNAIENIEIRNDTIKLPFKVFLLL